MFLAASSKSFGALIDVVLPMLMSQVIAVALATEKISAIMPWVAIMLVLTVLSFFANYYANTRAGIVSETIGNDMRKALYKHKQSLSIDDLKDVTYAELTTKIVYDIDTVTKFLATCMKMLMRQSIIGVGGLIVALSIDPYITIVLLVMMITMVVLSRCVFKSTGKWYRRASDGIDKSSGVIRGAITGIKTIKSFAKQGKEEKYFQGKIDGIYHDRVKAGTIDAILPSSVTVISNCTIVAIMCVSGWRVEDGFLDPVKLTAFVVYINLFIGAMVSVSRLMVRFAKTNSSLRRINEIFDIKPTEKVLLEENDSEEYAVKVSNLTFSYDNHIVLDDISFTLKYGESLGVVGQTGCGKTTFVEILTGIYHNYTGDIFIEKKNIRHVSQEEIAKSIGVARQKFDVFTGTVESNIILSKAYDEKRFDQAVQLSQISNFIDRKGKDLHIRQSGTNLSGGQRQRVNLARLFYNDPTILVLDDVSSALDTTTNALLNQSLKSVTDRKSVIYISNKIDSVKDFDKIIVLEGGKITGYDTHDRLMESNACYRKLASEQYREEVIYE